MALIASAELAGLINCGGPSEIQVTLAQETTNAIYSNFWNATYEQQLCRVKGLPTQDWMQQRLEELEKMRRHIEPWNPPPSVQNPQFKK
jgi:hypothetical protein